ncbi:MAG: tripartite tricarboxylate transporter permease, partial [Nanoarchaeota archaeon]|nr:tripartite tricarboxylate transporter permease [Nanoarchaeota archaeon]
MFYDIIIALLLGCLFGCITGLIPGIHVNLISVLLISLSGYLLGFTDPLSLSVFIIAMAITHTFLDSIPSVFLGAPDADMALGVLPGHKLLLEGKGYEAVKLTVIGSLLALIVTLLLIPIMIPFVPKIYSFIQPRMGYILIFVVLYMLFMEKKLNNIFWGSFVFIISGVLGIIVLGWPNLKQPLFPMLSGLFGISTLVVSLFQNAEIPKQHITETIKVSFNNKVKAIGAAVFSGSLTGLMPG